MWDEAIPPHLGTFFKVLGAYEKRRHFGALQVDLYGGANDILADKKRHVTEALF